MYGGLTAILTWRWGISGDYGLGRVGVYSLGVGFLSPVAACLNLRQVVLYFRVCSLQTYSRSQTNSVLYTYYGEAVYQLYNIRMTRKYSYYSCISFHRQTQQTVHRRTLKV